MATVGGGTSSAWATVRAMRDQDRAHVTYRHQGRWVEKTFAACAAEAEFLARGLADAGICTGDVVGLHGATSYYWLLADLACVLVGARSLALYPNAPVERAIGAARTFGAKLLFADNRRWCELYEQAGIPAALLGADGPQASCGRPLARGRTACRPLASSAQEPFTLVSTSGTLSEPRFFAVSSHSLLLTMDRFRETFRLGASDSLLMALPLAHLPQRMLAYGAMCHGINLVLSSPASFLQDTRERQPTIHVTVPRMLQYIDERITRQVSSRGQRALNFLGPLLSRVPRLVYRFAGARVFGPRARFIFVGSAPTPRPVMARLRALGCPIYEVYGTTELGIIAYTRPGKMRNDAIGQLVAWGTARVDSGTGELLFRTDLPFLTGEIDSRTIRPGGLVGRFVPTGDIGEVDADGFVRLRGRTRDFVALLSGEKMFVRPIEERLAAVDGVAGAIVVGDGQKHLSAVLFPSERLLEMAAPLREEFLRTRVAAVNEELSPEERVRRIFVPAENASVENGCLTETLKLRRHVINAKYASDYACFTPV